MAGNLRDWLASFGLEHLTQVFEENQVDLRDLPLLSEDDLKELGLALGPRRRLLNAISGLSSSGSAFAAEAPDSNESPTAAERRQLTVLFCDLVGSTELSARLDPEDMREALRRYQDATTGVVKRYGGHVAKYLGDGVLAYFGWPRAYEDQAERAVRAGLEAASAVRALPTVHGAALDARIGIATGQVVVGDLVGEGSRDAEAVTGETPNLAARLQGEAEPGQVVTDGTTRNLIAAAIVTESVGIRALKGFADPVLVWRAIGEKAAGSRFDATHMGPLTEFVGRKHELGLLLDRWDIARDGEGQVVLLSGEPGIGKSRLSQAFRNRLQDEPHTVLRYQCSPFHTNSALYPFIQQLGRAAGFAAADDPESKLNKLEAMLQETSKGDGAMVQLLGKLLSLPIEARFETLDHSPQEIKRRTLGALIDHVSVLAARQPILFQFEDAHWIDPTSEELLELMTQRIRSLPTLLLVTHRPEWQPPFRDQSHIATLQLNRLSRRQVEVIVRSIAGADISDTVLRRIAKRTDGVPLFVEELTKSLVESGLDMLQAQIPATIQSSLLARLDRLGQIAKEVAQIAAVIGRDFSYDLLHAVAGKPQADLNDALDRLVSSELVFRAGTSSQITFSFKHALIRDMAYESLLRRRREELHANIAKTIVDVSPQTVASEPELIARHLTEAGDHQQALLYWQNAGKLARERSAHKEEVAHIKEALALIDSVAVRSERQSLELALRRDLSSSMMITEGFAPAAVGREQRRFLELCEACDAKEEIPFALHGLWHYHIVRSELAKVHVYGQRLLALADERNDTYLQAEANWAIGGAFMFEGQLEKARVHLECSLERYSAGDHGGLVRDWGVDLGVFCRGYLSHNLWLLGLADRARATSQEAIARARAIDHPASHTVALAYDTMLHQFCRMPHAVLETVGPLEEMCNQYGFDYYRAWAGIMRSWAETEIAPNIEAIEKMRAAFADLQATDARLRSAHYHCLIAEQLLAVGDAEASDQALRQAEFVLAESDERWSSAEIHRVKGILALTQSDDPAEAEAHLKTAQDTAGNQSARALELRAAITRARLLRTHPRSVDARRLLEPVYRWFKEGFDTPDLRDAKALLDELS